MREPGDAILAHVDAALRRIPFWEDIEQGTQHCRDLAHVANRLREVKTRLTTMKRKAA